MSKTFMQGNAVRSRAVFRDADGELIDPAEVVCMVQTPDVTETTYTYGTDAGVLRISEGVYHFWIDTQAAAGTYTPRWKGSDGSHVIADEESFEVDASVFATP